MPTVGKNTTVDGVDTPPGNRVAGQIVTLKENIAVPNLVVVLFDVDPTDSKSQEALAVAIAGTNVGVTDALGKIGDRLGSALTDGSGSFTIEYEDEDFRREDSAETRPDLFLIVQAPDRMGQPLQRQIVFHSAELRRNAGRSESYFIQLDDAILAQWNLRVGAGWRPSTPDPAGVVQRQQAEDRFVDKVTEAGRGRFKLAMDNVVAARLDFGDGQQRPGNWPAGTPSRIGASTRVRSGETVAAVLTNHYQQQLEPIKQQYQVAQGALGMLATVVLNSNERALIGINPGDPNPPHSGRITVPEEHVEMLRGKFNTAGDNNLLMTSDNPILRECLHKAKNVQELEDLLNLPPPAPGQQ